MLEAPPGIFTVTELGNYIRDLLNDDPLLVDLNIIGEVFNHRKSQLGHHHFTLRDKDSSLRCVMFKQGSGGNYIEDGALVLVSGAVSFYRQRGETQLYARSIAPYGLGALQEAFEKLKTQLANEGLFEPSRKRPIPKFPAGIAIITSPTAAALQDILSVLQRRYFLANVYLIPATVQGEEAVPSLVTALTTLAQLPDVDIAILARGGGSLEDLWAFNEEAVARAVFAANVPIICGVGHETDTTIADLVADIRAPTPSAAAELVACDLSDSAQQIAETRAAITRAMVNMLREEGTMFDMIYERLLDNPPPVSLKQTQVQEMGQQLWAAAHELLRFKADQLDVQEAHLGALSPTKTLRRGYAMITHTGKVVSNANVVAVGDAINVTFDKNSLDATVQKVNQLPNIKEHN